MMCTTLPRSLLVPIVAALLSACSDRQVDDLGEPMRQHLLRAGPALPNAAEAGATGPADAGFAYSGRVPLEPAVGTYFGAYIHLDTDSIPELNARLGRDAATYVEFADFPMRPEDEPRIASFLETVADHRGIAVLTLEPRVPLWEITAEMAEELADYVAFYNGERELGIVVRFAHEMNGSWFSWSQQPTEYKRAFRLVADAVHQQTARTAMMWAPTYPGGYPFHDGPYEAQPGTEAFALLDTDRDGFLTTHDDAYLPYYPGDAYVDWVGLSLSHWGDAPPWGENQVPEPHKFVDQITGTYDGLAGDDTGLTDFYATFAEGHGKPMAIVETAALYNPGRSGAPELDIKRDWWRQVFDDEGLERFAHLRMISWFEAKKNVSEIGDELIDWTVTVDPGIREAFLADLPVDRLVFGPLPVYHPGN